jgi:hypothetical protein
MGSPIIFSGLNAKLLKANLDFFGKAFILTGEDDPTIVAKNAPKGSLYLRQTVFGNGEVYKKLDNGTSTAWVKVQDIDSSEFKKPANGFRMAFVDEFDVSPADASSLVLSFETTATYNLSKKLYRLSCDKTKTIASGTTSTNILLDFAPSFTVAVGDIIYLTSGSLANEWRRVASVNSQTDFIVDSAFSGVPATGVTTMISQAVYSKDLINAVGSASESTRPRDIFPNEPIPSINIDYFDSLLLDDNIPDFVNQACIVVSASNEGLQTDIGLPLSNTFAPIFTRPNAPDQIDDYPLLNNTNKERLHLVFFCNPNNTSVISAANLLGYRVSFYSEDLTLNGGLLNTAFCMSDGSGTEINCDAPYLVSGKTRVKLHWNFIPNLNAGETSGDLEVIVDGMVLPRFVSGATLDDYYIEVPGTTDTIEFSGDLSTSPLSIEIRRRQGVIDASTENTTKIDQLVSYEFISSSTTISIFNKFKKIITNSVGGPFTITLPANPEIGDTVYFHDGQEIWATNNVTVNRNGKNINGLASNLILDVNGGNAKLIYVDATQGWRVYT